MKDLFINSDELKTGFRETDQSYDKNPMVRLYCIQYPNYFSLQIRGSLPLVTDKQVYKKNLKKRNLIASVNLTREEIMALAEYVKNYLKEYDAEAPQLPPVVNRSDQESSMDRADIELKAKENYTELELVVLRNIRLSEYIDFSDPRQLINQPAWSFSVTVGRENKGYTPVQVKGAMGSCVKKGLIGCQNDGTDDETCWLTEKGLAVLIEKNLL
jgi:hypothetical protein